MANIPVRKTNKIPWWAWVLGLIAIGLLIWLLLDVVLDDDDADEVAQPVATTQATADTDVDAPSAEASAASPEATAPLTDISAIAAATDPALAGRAVDLRSVEVRSVVGDRTFWIGPTTELQTLVVLDETSDPAGVEGLVDVNEGQQVSLTGEVRAMPSPAQARQMFDLSEQNSAGLTGEPVYLHADKVTVQK